MHFDVAAIPANEAYKLLVSTVVPRPIALATTVDATGRINAAPFSFFNAVSSVPPVVVLGISPGDPDAPPNDGYKDTERNIRDTGEFVVNLVDEAIAERMNVCAVDFPNAVGELEHADLHPIPSIGVRPPRIAESPVSFECKRITGLSLGPRSTLEVGRVIHIHIRDDLVDPAALLRRDRQDAPYRPHARPRLVCPDQRLVPDGPHQLRRLERRQAMTWRPRFRSRGSTVCRGVCPGVCSCCRVLALYGAPSQAFEPPLGGKNFTPPSFVPNYFSNEAAPFGRGRSPPQPGADRFNTAPVAASGGYAATSEPPRNTAASAGRATSSRQAGARQNRPRQIRLVANGPGACRARASGRRPAHAYPSAKAASRHSAATTGPPPRPV